MEVYFMLKEDLLTNLSPYITEIIQNDIVISLSTEFVTAGMDSINFISLIVKCEELYNIETNDEELVSNNYNTFDDFISMILRHLDNKNQL